VKTGRSVRRRETVMREEIDERGGGLNRGGAGVRGEE
jgi:hypothetical protein